MSQIYIGVQAKSKVIDHQQENQPRIMYTRKEVLPTKRLRVWRVPACVREFEVGCHGLEVKIKLVLATIGL